MPVYLRRYGKFQTLMGMTQMRKKEARRRSRGKLVNAGLMELERMSA